MIQAILDGRKTQTRREFKLKHCNKKMTWANEPYSIVNDVNFKSQITGEIFIPKNAYGLAGDILWIKETYYAYGYWHVFGHTKTGKQKYKFIDLTNGETFGYYYLADNVSIQIEKGRTSKRGWYKRPSLFMPKEACRLRLKIKSIRVERLMDISEQDAIAEGVRQRFGGFINYANPSNLFTETYPFLSRKYSAAQMSYLSLWEKINGENSFEENPWVWVIEFERA